MNHLMDTNIKILAIALVAISIGVAPSLLVNKSVYAAYYCTDEIGKSNAWIAGCKEGWNKGECKSTPNYCTDYSGKSHSWVAGCKQGWWDHNHCWGYSPGSGDYA